MEENILPKGFFKKNPLRELSAAAIADYSAKVEPIDEFNDKINDIVDATMTNERRTRVEQDKHEVDMLTSGEDVERYMRKKHDILVYPLLCKKALSLIEDAAPHIIKRYKTTAQDAFIELAFRIFVHADKWYAEELFTAYHDIRNPYAQATACLLFGEHDMKPSVPLLIKEYKRFQTDYPSEGFDQFPLLALYILFGKA